MIFLFQNETEPSSKRPALQSKNLNTLNSTISYLQNLTPNQQIMKNTFEETCNENVPYNKENTQVQLKKTPLKSPKKHVPQIKKSPFKFPGLDLHATHSKSM